MFSDSVDAVPDQPIPTSIHPRSNWKVLVHVLTLLASVAMWPGTVLGVCGHFIETAG